METNKAMRPIIISDAFVHEHVKEMKKIFIYKLALIAFLDDQTNPKGNHFVDFDQIPKIVYT